MNLSTRRLTGSELMNWVEKNNRRIWTFRVSDKFGDSGLTGLVGVEWDNRQIQMTDFLLSCRVMGRKIEETMLHVAYEFGRVLNLETLAACYLKTKKNCPCYTFWKNSGFNHDDKTNTFIWKIEDLYPQPECINIINQ